MCIIGGDGRNWPCDECEYVATHQYALKEHIETKHDEVTFDCRDVYSYNYISKIFELFVFFLFYTLGTPTFKKKAHLT